MEELSQRFKNITTIEMSSNNVKGSCKLNMDAKRNAIKEVVFKLKPNSRHMGAFADEDMRRWTEIAEYEPISRFRWDGGDGDDKHLYATHWAWKLADRFARLEKEEAETLYQFLFVLYPRNPFKKDDDLIFWISEKLNHCAYGDSKQHDVYLDLSYYNHSCRPNCIQFVEANGTAHLFTTRDIRKGEELFVCYLLDANLTNKQRREQLRLYYDFDCMCEVCLGGETELGPVQWMRSGLDRCAECGKPNALACKGCKFLSYCSRDCQKEGWKRGHKEVCKHLGYLAEAAKNRIMKQ